MGTLQALEAKTFTHNWWEHFLSTTENLSKTSVFKNCMDREETEKLRNYVLEIVATLCALRTSRYGFRVYIDGVLLNTYRMNAIYDAPPLPGESMEDWVERAFGDRKFGMIINLGERFNLPLSKNIALKTQYLFEEVGFPREGINFTLFIGNYDKTPLGIHKDPLGQNVIHFHLGPGNKTMYTWSKELYESLTVTKKFDKQDVEGLLPYSTEFNFDEGDLYFMPEGEFHIGKQEGLSMAITLWQYNHTRGDVAKKLQAVVFSQFFNPSNELLLPDRNDLDDVSGVNEILSTFNLSGDLQDLNFKDLMIEAYRDLRYSIHSNAGYRTSPFPKTEDHLFALEDKVQSIAPYKILYKHSLKGDKLHVFIRGIKLELNNFHCIKKLIDTINQGEPHTVAELLGILDQEWSDETGLYILGLLYKNHGIEKV
jgi:hypothetical protein